MNKYGVDNFSFQVIDEENNSDKLCELEKYYIEKYRTYVGFDDCNGYNATLGGDGKSYLNLDEQEVIRVHQENDYIIGKTAQYFQVDPDAIKKILKKHNINWLSNPEITKRRYKQQYGGLVQYDDYTNKIINIFDCPGDAVREFGYNRKTLKSAANQNNKNSKAYGYEWYRLKELPENLKPLLDLYYKNIS